MGNCLNVFIEQELGICSNPTCKSVLGSFDSEKNLLALLQVREVLFRPLGSYVRGSTLHNVNTFRMMYMEMLERDPPFAPRIRLNIPQHTIEPVDNVAACEDNIYQVASTSGQLSAGETGVAKTVRVRDIGSYRLFGKNQNFLGRMIVIKKEDKGIQSRPPAFENVVEQANRTIRSGSQILAVNANDFTAAGKFLFHMLPMFSFYRMLHFFFLPSLLFFYTQVPQWQVQVHSRMIYQ